MNLILIYTEFKTARLEYIAQFLFGEILGLQYEITNDATLLNTSEAFVINYSEVLFSTSNLHIKPNGLLSQTSIEPQTLDFGMWHQLPCFFLTSSQEIPFDILSAAFYLLSRYEEYLPYTPDLYQRFPVENSVAWQQNFLTMPLIDLWMMELKKVILATQKNVFFPEKKMQFIPTYDIDIAYSYQGKGILRTIGGALKDVLHKNMDLFQQRINVLISGSKDPYDSFDFLDELHKSYSLKPIYFFLVSDGGTYDKNIAPQHHLMKELIRRIQSTNQIGVHPSYKSHEDINTLKKEISRVQSHKSRQHYIRFAIPQTFKNLLACNIHEDYSMGYGSRNGFRASTSFPHYWFDLSTNNKTKLQLFPFCFMECNSFFEQKISSSEAFEELMHYKKMVEQVKGTLITIWHNFSLGDDTQWEGWKEMYVDFIVSLKKTIT